jgi:TonB dependent receptor/TonB-dependent Receptor Plug Domain
VKSPLALLIVIAFAGFAAPAAFTQANNGELRLNVVDPSGLAVKATIEITSQANQYRNTLATDGQGHAVAQRLPFGIYQIEVSQPGFAAYTQVVEIRSEIPAEYTLQLKISAVNQSVNVNATSTLIDPDQAGAVSQIGSSFIQNRLSSIPGRSMQDLVNSQPGWLYEGNAVLHPRGSEYQTQFVVDGIPLTDNRSPSFGPEMEADDVQSMSVYTAGFPAEYGRKMGGVVEVNTAQDSQPGFHGQVVLSGGSFDSAGAFAEGQYSWGKNTLGGSAGGDMTDHYLNPVVPQNFTNKGTLGDFSVNYQRDFTPKNRLSLIVRHELSRYELPNEQVQEAAGQLQTADNFETMGIASYEHTFSSNVVADLRGMVRDNSNDFYSNPESTPIEVFQHNRYREGYLKGSMTISHGRHEVKVGIETDNTYLHENTAYNITDLADCGPDSGDDALFRPRFAIRPMGTPGGTSCSFSFIASRPDLEQSAFVQDLIHLGNWTINAGVRWDHYQLILNRQAVDPRFSISRYFPTAGVIVHFSYDRVFQTPSFANLLLSSSAEVESIDPTSFLRLPVEPSEGNYYEVGVTKAFGNKLRLDENYFRRLVSNYADDDQIDNTTISFPIAFRKSIIYGAETKIEVPQWGRFSGFLSYSYEVGNAWNPVTGGLFFGDDASAAETALTGHFPDSQDQRNTVRGRVRYQVAPRLWIAAGIQYDTGLPFEFECPDGESQADCIAGEVATYGQKVVDRINFNRGRIFPSFQVSASVGADVYRSDKLNVRFQADGENLNNVLDVIDFGGLFSGNAVGPPRSFSLRLTTSF